jgi:hypothetical protein
LFFFFSHKEQALPRYPHADDAVFSSSIKQVIHHNPPFEHGAAIDRMLAAMREQFDALCKLDRIYSEAGCDFGYVHFRERSRKFETSQRAAKNKGPMVVNYPAAANGHRERKYIGVDPLKQFDATAAIERYKLRNELRLQFVALHEQYSDIAKAIEHLSARGSELRQSLMRLIREASDRLTAFESELQRKRWLLQSCRGE